MSKTDKDKSAWQFRDTTDYSFAGDFIDGWDKEKWLSAFVGFGGCVDLTRHYDDNEQETMHLCDLDSAIDALTQLRDHARKHFGDHWPI